MKKIILEESGQSSAEMILLIGGILVIVIIIGNYITEITNKINNSLKILLKKEKDYIINKL